MKSQKNGQCTAPIARYFVIYKRSPLKMQKIIKPRSPIRQLLETVNFAFMKIFDFLVKIAVFRASLFFLEIRVMHYGRNRTRDPGRTA